VVLGRGADRVKESLAGRKNLFFFIQKERRGSGDAVRPAAGWLSRRGGDVVVLCGDAPLIRPQTLKALVARHRREKNAATLLTATVVDPTGYGRIRRGLDDRPRAIVEHRDASPEDRAIREINSGIGWRAQRSATSAKRPRPKTWRASWPNERQKTESRSARKQSP
jgi:bifunctional UDP-N-acetylglucosamine pyrophosphorylase/glucosamine-1-phosphate N-acetyltransferase